MNGSLQLRQYLEARHAARSREDAAALARMNLEEARLTDIADERGEIDLAPWPLDHNQPKENTVAEGTVAADELRLLIERIERLEEEKKALSEDIKDVYAEAKSRGYDAPTVRLMVRIRKLETHVRQEKAALAETYAVALGMEQLVLL